MARTRLFSLAGQLLSLPNSGGDRPRAITRRHMLALSGAATLGACAPIAATRNHEPGIAIVGGGVAGLTVAYRLALAGKPATLYEASSRFGGRMFTKRQFNDEGMFCELGGELVDTGHLPLIALAKELGIGLQKLKDGQGENIYAIGGKLHSERDMLREGQGVFLPIARQIAREQKVLTDEKENWTVRARALDQMSVAAYLKLFRGWTQDWAIDLLDLAYLSEYGIPTDRQSALNLIDFIGTDVKENFAMFGKSDEAFRIQGGSSSLTDALYARLGSAVAQKANFALSAIAADKGTLRLSFTTPQGQREAVHDQVVLALPFTKLREVQGLDALGLDAMKLKSIRELGYGDNGKVMVGTRGRPWNEKANLPVPSDGEFYSEAFQVVWDTSRGQAGTRGILTNFLSGVQSEGAALGTMQRGLQAVSPRIANSLDFANTASFFWAGHPFTRGSYAGAKIGQYTTLLEGAGTPELGGRLHFAGEHTSVDFLGFMCGGVESGERVAAALLGAKQTQAVPLARAVG